MSKSNPTLQNPCKKFIEFKSDKGLWFYYDKEQAKGIEVEMPFYFVVLDELTTITGYSDKHNCGIYSNEIHRTDREQLRVRSWKGGEYIVGLYNDIRDNVVAIGGRYTKSIYAMLINKDKTTELVNLRLHGGSFAEWMNKRIDTNNFIVGVTGLDQRTKGKNKYNVPVFQGYKLSEDMNAKAIEMDKHLQAYLKEYMEQQSEQELSKAEAVTAAASPAVTPAASSAEPWIAPPMNEKWFKESRKKSEEEVEAGSSDLPF